jgi:F-type H+-transporting ATPase subunit a
MTAVAHISTLVSTSESCHLFPAGCGYPAPDAGIFEFPSILEFTVAGVTVHFTKPMLLLLLAAALIVVFFVAAFRKAKIVPRGIQNVGEMGYLFVRDGIARDTIGREGDAVSVTEEPVEPWRDAIAWPERRVHPDESMPFLL